ncbi:antibiotic biosynthesis monooxygenase [Leifsonia sp. NPDC077715]|uniref:putative quinol monooxygenase n=1 Tax=Leifsonia sp. NPDC077715 TaxID=3155539 RepID=UPI00344433BE
MPKFGFLVEFEALPGQEESVAEFLVAAKKLVDDEPGTLAWFSFQTGPAAFRIFDAFETENDRAAHLQGKVRQAIERQAEQLFTAFPTITPVDILASKLP